MSVPQSEEFANLYAQLQAPIAALDCGQKCAPHNDYGVPFCCDTGHAVPSAYLEEWAYLQAHTDLWHPWADADAAETERLRAETPAHQTLIECLGHTHCQRGYRSLTCRAFPFFPYINQQAAFIGLAYYWQYEDRCWVISNLHAVTAAYRQAFVTTYERIFTLYPAEFLNFRHHSQVMRRVFGRRKRAIPLLHRNGSDYKITPRNGRLRRVPAHALPSFGPYAIADLLPFPDEL